MKILIRGTRNPFVHFTKDLMKLFVLIYINFFNLKTFLDSMNTYEVLKIDRFTCLPKNLINIKSQTLKISKELKKIHDFRTRIFVKLI